MVAQQHLINSLRKTQQGDASRDRLEWWLGFTHKNPQPLYPRAASAEGLQAWRISSRNIALIQNGYG